MIGSTVRNTDVGGRILCFDLKVEMDCDDGNGGLPDQNDGERMPKHFTKFLDNIGVGGITETETQHPFYNEEHARKLDQYIGNAIGAVYQDDKATEADHRIQVSLDGDGAEPEAPRLVPLFEALPSPPTANLPTSAWIREWDEYWAKRNCEENKARRDSIDDWDSDNDDFLNACERWQGIPKRMKLEQDFTQIYVLCSWCCDRICDDTPCQQVGGFFQGHVKQWVHERCAKQWHNRDCLKEDLPPEATPTTDPHRPQEVAAKPWSKEFDDQHDQGSQLDDGPVATDTMQCDAPGKSSHVSS